MKSNREYTDYLQDILEAATKARQFVKDVDFEAFRANEEKVFAVIRALEIIGEAAKNIPKSIRGRYTEIPWEDIVGMRNKVIHKFKMRFFNRLTIFNFLGDLEDGFHIRFATVVIQEDLLLLLG